LVDHWIRLFCGERRVHVVGYGGFSPLCRAEGP
jgi:hypothetical protein